MSTDVAASRCRSAGNGQNAPVDLQRWRVAAGDLLLGSTCHGCATPAWNLCPACRAVLDTTPARPTRPQPCPPGFPVTWTAGPYDALMQGLISAQKERQASGLTGVLGERLALALVGLLDEVEVSDRPDAGDRAGAVVLVPVPSTRAAVRARGFDAALALARAAAVRVPRRPVKVAPLLEPARRVADQSGLGEAARWRNLSGAYRLRRRPAPSRGAGSTGAVALVVVDDLVTTGSSLCEASRTLRAAGLPVLGAATVAATRRTRPAR